MLGINTYRRMLYTDFRWYPRGICTSADDRVRCKSPFRRKHRRRKPVCKFCSVCRRLRVRRNLRCNGRLRRCTSLVDHLEYLAGKYIVLCGTPLCTPLPDRIQCHPGGKEKHNFRVDKSCHKDNHRLFYIQLKKRIICDE